MGVLSRVFLVAAAVAASSVTSAQITTPESPYPDHYPPALPDRKGPDPPKLRFERLSSVSLPGPLPGTVPVVLDGAVLVEVAGGWARVPLAAPEAQLDAPAPSAPAPDPWVVAPDGKLRFRVGDDTRTILAEERSRFARDGWNRAWRLRFASAIPAPPLLVGQRLCFATLGDQVSCVRDDNGHRLWAVDVGSRVSRPLEIWRGAIPIWSRRTNRVTQEDLEVLLVVPDHGNAVVALDAWDGEVLATEPISPSEGWLVTGVRVVGPAEIAVGRQGDVDADGGLLLFRLASPEQRPGPDAAPDVSYNPSTPGR